MNGMRRGVTFVAALLLSSGCQDRARPAESAEEAARAAISHLSRMKFNMSFRVLRRKVDMGDRWRLTYGDPAGGATIIVVVDKRSGKVVHVEADQ